jgi:hypothetical protein
VSSNRRIGLGWWLLIVVLLVIALVWVASYTLEPS